MYGGIGGSSADGAGAGGKGRIVEEALARGALVSEVARQHDEAESLLFTWGRLARTAAQPRERGGPILLPVEIEATAPSLSEATRRSCSTTSGRDPASSRSSSVPGNRLRVDNDADTEALRWVLRRSAEDSSNLTAGRPSRLDPARGLAGSRPARLKRRRNADPESPVVAQLSRSAYVRNLAYRFRSFMAIDRKVSAHRGSSK